MTVPVQPVQCDPGDHEWVAFSTALEEGWIMVQCVKCGEPGPLISRPVGNGEKLTMLLRRHIDGHITI